MTRRITDDEMELRIVEWMGSHVGARSAGSLAETFDWRYPETAILRRLRALRDEGRVVEVAGPRGSLWRLP